MKTFASMALASVAAAASNNWAVVMSGNHYWANYNCQADSHHVVQLLKKNGVPREQIIHLAYDDVANDPANPFPGQLFNKPTDKGTPGVNVYDASDIDYRGDDVSKTNFFNALLGNDENGPALKSNENSNVFVYYCSYGGLGQVNTPGGSLDTIYAEQLASTLIKMHDTKMYNELVFYLEGS